MPDKTQVFDFNLPIPCGDRGIWGQLLNDNWELADTLISLNRKRQSVWMLPYMAASGLYMYAGFQALVLGAAAVAPGPATTASVGTSKLSLEVNAGADLDGVLTLTGDSRHPSTGEVIVGDTETIALTGTGRYTSLKTWVGDVDLSTTDLDVSDVDVYSLALFDNAGQPFELESIQLLGTSLAAGATLTTELKRFRKTAGQFTVSELIPSGELDIGATPAGAQYWNLSYSTGLPLIQSDQGEGIFGSVTLTGSAGDWKDVRLALNYRIKPNAA